jgi:hypothetical protein
MLRRISRSVRKEGRKEGRKEVTRCRRKCYVEEHLIIPSQMLL